MPFVIGVLGIGGPVSAYGSDEQRYKATHQNFRAAMAAPAGLAEFRGSVVNVLTENCWDPLQAGAEKKKEEINRRINQMKKEGRKFAQGEEQELSAKMMSETCTPAELEACQGISNLAFHYLGSTKILGCIGESFAEAMAPLAKKTRTPRRAVRLISQSFFIDDAKPDRSHGPDAVSFDRIQPRLLNV